METYDKQRVYYGTDEQDDIGKILHMLGSAYKRCGQNQKAYDVYKEALRVKKCIGVSEDMIKVTENEMNKIKQALEAEEKLYGVPLTHSYGQSGGSHFFVAKPQEIRFNERKQEEKLSPKGWCQIL